MRQNKAILRDIFIALKPDSRKRLRFHFQNLEKEEQSKSKVNDKKEIIKRTEFIKERADKQ